MSFREYGGLSFKAKNYFQPSYSLWLKTPYDKRMLLFKDFVTF